MLPSRPRSKSALVAALAARAPSFLATIPAGDELTRSFLPNALGTEIIELGAKESSPPNSLGRLQDHLFANPPSSNLDLDGTVTVVSAPGEMHEAVEIARRIQDEARHGVAFDRIAVLCHVGERYGPYLEEALNRAGIPAYFATGTRRPEPGGRALLQLLSCASENLSAKCFAEYLSLAQVPDPDAKIASADAFASPGGGSFLRAARRRPRLCRRRFPKPSRPKSVRSRSSRARSRRRGDGKSCWSNPPSSAGAIDGSGVLRESRPSCAASAANFRRKKVDGSIASSSTSII